MAKIDPRNSSATANPASAMLIRTARMWIFPAKPGPTHASLNQMKKPAPSWVGNFASGFRGMIACFMGGERANFRQVKHISPASPSEWWPQLSPIAFAQARSRLGAGGGHSLLSVYRHPAFGSLRVVSASFRKRRSRYAPGFLRSGRSGRSTFVHDTLSLALYFLSLPCGAGRCPRRTRRRLDGLRVLAFPFACSHRVWAYPPGL